MSICIARANMAWIEIAGCQVQCISAPTAAAMASVEAAKPMPILEPMACSASASPLAAPPWPARGAKQSTTQWKRGDLLLAQNKY